MAWLFNESNSCYVTLGDAAAMTLANGDWAIAGWLKSAGNAGSLYQYFFSWGTVDASPDLNLWLIEASGSTNPNKLKCVALAGGQGQASANEWVSDSNPGATTTWHHIVLQRKSGLLYMYVDGVANAATVSPPGELNVAGDLYLGVRNDLNADRCFGGRLAEWACWNGRSLTDVEIARLAGVGGYIRTRPSGLSATGRGWYLPMKDFSESWASLTVTNQGASVDADHPIDYDAYNPASDPNCEAWWRLEDGALTVDAAVRGHTLSNTAVVADTGNFQEGAACGDWEADSSAVLGLWTGYMDSGYPLKEGTTNRVISVCFWMKAESLPGSGAYAYLYVHWNNLWILLYNDGTGSRIALVNWYNGGANYEIDQHASTLSVDTWYHVGVAYDGDAKTYRIRIWDDGAGAILGTDKTGTKANSVGIAAGDAQLGSAYDGKLDDYLVFNRVLTARQIDLIRLQQSYKELAGSVAAVSTIGGDLTFAEPVGTVQELNASLTVQSTIGALASTTHAVTVSVSSFATCEGVAERVLSAGAEVSAVALVTGGLVFRLPTVWDLPASITATSSLAGKLSYGVRYENWIGTCDFEMGVSDGFKLGQTFTPQANHYLTQADVKLFLDTAPVTGTLTLSIYATSAGVPTGSPLRTQEIDYSGLPGDWPGVVVEVFFRPGITLNAGTMYALVLDLTEGDGTIGVTCQSQADGGPYPRGAIVSNDDGLGHEGDWRVVQENMDFYFSEYGGPYWPWVECSSTVAALSQMTAILNHRPPLAGRLAVRSQAVGRIQYKAGTYVPAQVLAEPYPIPTLWQYVAGLGSLEPGGRDWARAFGQGVQDWAASLEQWSQEHMTRVMRDVARLGQEKTGDWVDA